MGVSTDMDEQMWINALEEEQMDWQQVLDNSSISELYNITYIPMIYLINADGVIIDKGLHGESMRKRIEELYK